MAWELFGTDSEEQRKGFVQLKTRLGDESINAVPVIETNSGWRLLGDSIDINHNINPSRAWHLRAAQSQLRFNRDQDISILINQPRPTWWERSAVLRHLYLFRVSEDGLSIDLRNTVLDAELGLLQNRTTNPSEEEE